MNVVLYTQDFEPITVLDLPLWLLDQLEQQGCARLAALSPAELEPQDLSQPTLEIVNIYCEKLHWIDGSLKPVLITDSEELALTLSPVWLPGQQQAINNYEQRIKHLVDSLVRAMRK